MVCPSSALQFPLWKLFMGRIFYSIVDDIQKYLMKHGFISQYIRTFFNDNFTVRAAIGHLGIFGNFLNCMSCFQVFKLYFAVFAWLSCNTSCIISAILSISSIIELILVLLFFQHQQQDFPTASVHLVSLWSEEYQGHVRWCKKNCQVLHLLFKLIIKLF